MSEEQKITSNSELQAVLDRITTAKFSRLDFGWKFRLERVSVVASFCCGYPVAEGFRHAWLLWAEFERIDLDTGIPGIGRGRDEIIWEGTTVSGVVKTAWVVFQKLIEHEMMHTFQFDGAPLFDPHATVDRLRSISGIDRGDTYNLEK